MAPQRSARITDNARPEAVGDDDGLTVAARLLVERSVGPQNIEAEVTDPDALRRVATVLRSARVDNEVQGS